MMQFVAHGLSHLCLAMSGISCLFSVVVALWAAQCWKVAEWLLLWADERA